MCVTIGVREFQFLDHSKWSVSGGSEDWASNDWDWQSKLKDWWGPLWWLKSVKDWVNNVHFEPLEDVNAEFVKWWDDDLHELVPHFDDPSWDEEEDLNDDPEDVPDEFQDDPVDVPEPVIDLHEDWEDPPVNLPEEVRDEPSEPDEQGWDEVQDEDNEGLDFSNEIEQWLDDLIDWKPDAFIDGNMDLYVDVPDQINDEVKEEEDGKNDQGDQSDDDKDNVGDPLWDEHAQGNKFSLHTGLDTWAQKVESNPHSEQWNVFLSGNGHWVVVLQNVFDPFNIWGSSVDELSPENFVGFSESVIPNIAIWAFWKLETAAESMVKEGGGDPVGIFNEVFSTNVDWVVGVWADFSHDVEALEEVNELLVLDWEAPAEVVANTLGVEVKVNNELSDFVVVVNAPLHPWGNLKEHPVFPAEFWEKFSDFREAFPFKVLWSTTHVPDLVVKGNFVKDFVVEIKFEVTHLLLLY